MATFTRMPLRRKVAKKSEEEENNEAENGNANSLD